MMIAKKNFLSCLSLFCVLVGLEQAVLATSGDSPYTSTVVVDTNADPDIVETTIIAEHAMVDIGNGVMAHAQTFNGTIPGPEFRLKVGDTVIVHFENHMEHVTGIHWHGIELNNASDGTPLTQNQVGENETFLYKFIVTRPGIYWYHPHHHASTNQLFRGMFGLIIVEDPYEADLQAAGVLPPESQTLSLALSDITVCKLPRTVACPAAEPGHNDCETHAVGSNIWKDGDVLPSQSGPQPVTLCEAPTAIDDEGALTASYAEGDVPSIQPSGTSGRVNEGQTVITNGMNVGGRAGWPSSPGALDPGALTYDVLAGQGLRLHMGSESTTRFFRLRLTGTVGGVAGTKIPLIRVGGQGGLLDDAVEDGGIINDGVMDFDFKYETGEILLDPGSRADVVAAIPDNATGVLTLWTMDFSRTGAGFSNIPTVPVMHLNVTGAAGSTYTIAAGTALRSSILGAAVEALGAATGALLDPDGFAPPKDGCSPLNPTPCTPDDIRLTNVANLLGVDNVHGEHDFPGIPEYTDVPHMDSARYAELGDILEMTVTNATGAHHPFHLHGFSIQPLDLTKAGAATYTFPYPEYFDNIDVPANYTLRFRVRLDDRPLIDGVTPGGGLGRWVFHCHIFFHASFGMISEFDVVAADGNERPYVNANSGSVEVDEGQVAAMTGTYDDPDGDAVTLAASFGTLVDNLDGTWSWSYATTDGPDETQFVYITATDANGYEDQAAFEMIVNNIAPSLTITSPPDGSLYAAPASVMVTASVTDPGTADVLTCTFNWDDGGPTTDALVVAGVCSDTHNFPGAGVYTVSVTASDDDGGTSAPSTVMIIVYDPTAGFVTGGGTIISPPGAYPEDPTLTGIATFGFVSKYQRGRTVPTGQTEFQFQAAGFNFHSSSYQWLVISGAKAQYKGTGTVNGAGNYGFLLTATDGQVSGGGGVDKFRVKVWNPSAGGVIVYDNVLGAPVDIDVANPQAIATGSIVIHKK